MSNVIFDLVSSLVLAGCGICVLYTGITRRKKQKPNNILTVIMILCGIASAIAPFIRTFDITLTPMDGYAIDRFVYMMYAFTYAALIWLHTAIYRVTFQKNNDRLQKLVFGFSVLVAFMLLLSAVMLFVSAGSNILSNILKD